MHENYNQKKKKKKKKLYDTIYLHIIKKISLQYSFEKYNRILFVSHNYVVIWTLTYYLMGDYLIQPSHSRIFMKGLTKNKYKHTLICSWKILIHALLMNNSIFLTSANKALFVTYIFLSDLNQNGLIFQYPFLVWFYTSCRNPYTMRGLLMFVNNGI